MTQSKADVEMALAYADSIDDGPVGMCAAYATTLAAALREAQAEIDELRTQRDEWDKYHDKLDAEIERLNSLGRERDGAASDVGCGHRSDRSVP